MSAPGLDGRVETTGRASRERAPARVSWHLKLSEQAATPRDAFDACAERAAGMVERLRALLPEAEVTTGPVRVQPDWDERRGRPRGHAASASVIIDDVAERAGAAAAVAMDAGADELHGPQRAWDRAPDVEGELLGEAVADARRRAEALAAAAGRRLGGVVGVRDLVARPPRHLEDQDEAIALAASAASRTRMPVAPGAGTEAVSVLVVFALEAA